jgi:hypothetical protein
MASQQGGDPQPGGQQPPGQQPQPGGPKPMGSGEQPGQPGQPNDQTQGSGKAQPGKEFTPGPGGTGADLGPGEAANREFQKRSGDLQLEEFRKQAKNKEFLKKMNMSEEEYQQFIKGYEDMLKRQQAQQQVEDNRQFAPGSRGGPSSLNTAGPRRVKSGTGNPGDLENAGIDGAPPEYRKAYKEFTEELAKPKSPREKR